MNSSLLALREKELRFGLSFKETYKHATKEKGDSGLVPEEMHSKHTWYVPPLFDPLTLPVYKIEKHANKRVFETNTCGRESFGRFKLLSDISNALFAKFREVLYTCYHTLKVMKSLKLATAFKATACV